MTDERMTQGDVRLREELAREATYALVNRSRLPLWMQGAALGRSMSPLGDLVVERLLPVVERIVAARVGEVVERVEAVCDEWDRMSEADPYDPGNPGGYADEIRAALRAADAPLAAREDSGGHGDAGGADRAGGGE